MARNTKTFTKTTIRDWRLHVGMSLLDLATAMDMNEGYLSDLENGKRRYNQDIIEKAALVLKVPPAWLISRKPVPKIDDRVDYSDPDVAATVMADMEPVDRERVGAVIKTYKKPPTK